jgi:hypothetical protein
VAVSLLKPPRNETAAWISKRFQIKMPAKLAVDRSTLQYCVSVHLHLVLLQYCVPYIILLLLLLLVVTIAVMSLPVQYYTHSRQQTADGYREYTESKGGVIHGNATVRVSGMFPISTSRALCCNTVYHNAVTVTVFSIRLPRSCVLCSQELGVCVELGYYIGCACIVGTVYCIPLPSYALYTVIPYCPLPAVGSAERSGPSGPLL